MEVLELTDIQGIIIRGYSNMPACEFILAGIKDPQAAKTWLRKICPQITPGDKKDATSALNIAFTFEGLRVLGLNKDALDSFPIELEDGMTTEHKQFFLGDYGSSDPANWEWGNSNQEPVHVLLMLYAVDSAALQELHHRQASMLNEQGLVVIRNLDTSVLYERKEHFGFHDGISQPVIKGLSKTDEPENMVSPGEFILGYKNEYHQYADSPAVSGTQQTAALLPAVPSAPGKYDLGKNGTYVVFRQMKQDVELFWNYMEKCTLTEKGEADRNEMIKLAAKMVGRWPGGAPIVICPDKENTDHNNTNVFNYRKIDSTGLMCPYASHIRRSNPRDALDTDRHTSMKVANRHRLLRRGRSYGQPVTETMNPEDILKTKNIAGERGLHFICFNADIGRQFEFVQNAWINNPKFLGLFDERDPITGNHSHPEEEHHTGTFSIPGKGLRKRYTDVPEFVTVKGGSYFFMPGIKALTYLASI